MINFLRITGNIKLGDFLHCDGAINNIASSDIIGVCVIPSNFLPDKRARFISMVAMDSQNKEKGNYRFNGGMVWYLNYSTLDNNYKMMTSQKTMIPIDKKLDGTISSAGIVGHVPIMTYDNREDMIINRQDPETIYLRRIADRIPSPYALDGSFNPLFHYRRSDSNNTWALTDYRGDLNTERVISIEKPREDYCPAFYCCHKFSPGYMNNKWYLPAIGELAFIPPRLKLIRYKILEAINAGSPGIALSSGNYWSSTERSNSKAWSVTLHAGYIHFFDKDSNNYIRAFLAI